MKEQKQINWQEDNKISKSSLGVQMMAAFWNGVAILLLMFSGLIMYLKFGKEVHLENDHVQIICGVVIATLFYFEVGYKKMSERAGSKLKVWFLRILFLGVYAFFVNLAVRHLIHNYGDHLIGGLRSAEELFINRYSYVLCANLVVIGTEPKYLSLGICLSMIALFMAFYLLSGFGKKKGIFVAIPGFMVCLIMYLGIAPDRYEIIMMALGLFMLRMSGKRERRFYPGMWPKAAAFLGVLLLGGILFAVPIKILFSYHDEAKVIELDIERRFSQAFTGRRAFENQRVSNNPPRYQDAKVMKIRMDKEPTGTLYLKNFYSYNFVDGMWENPQEGFDELCTAAGKDPMVASGLTPNIMEPYVNFTNEYYGLFQNEILLPYGAVLSEEDHAILQGDSAMLKDRTDRSVSYKGIHTNRISISMLFSGKTDEERMDYDDWYITYIQNQSKAPSGYARFIMDDPVAQVMYDSFAEGLEEYIDIEKAQQEFEEKYDELDKDSFSVIREVRNAVVPGLEEVEIWVDGEALVILIPMKVPETVKPIKSKDVLSWAELVSQYLRKQYQYSFDLDELDKDQDVIEYFLQEGKKGFCVHFASAGTILLRELGLPARYASGYVVDPKEFRRVDGYYYEADVIDRNAHAWTEVYVSGRGWVPVEMTPGYGQETIATGTSLDEMLPNSVRNSNTTPNNNSRSKEETKETVSEEKESTESEEITKEEDQEKTDREKTEQEKTDQEKEKEEKEEKAIGKNSDKKDSGNKSGQGKGSKESSSALDSSDGSKGSNFLKNIHLKNLGKIFLKVMEVLAVIALLGGLITLYIRIKTNEMRHALRRKNHKKVVKILNRKIHKKVHVLGNKKTDQMFLEELIRALGQENRNEAEEYMKVVKEAAFSKDRLTKDQYKIVKNMYRKICKAKKKPRVKKIKES